MTGARDILTVKVELVTLRGLVYIEFFNTGELLEIRAKEECNWTNKEWKRERARLIRRAREVCKKIGEFK